MAAGEPGRGPASDTPDATGPERLHPTGRPKRAHR
jgi:hypothetical protein